MKEFYRNRKCIIMLALSPSLFCPENVVCFNVCCIYCIYSSALQTKLFSRSKNMNPDQTAPKEQQSDLGQYCLQYMYFRLPTIYFYCSILVLVLLDCKMEPTEQIMPIRTDNARNNSLRPDNANQKACSTLSQLTKEFAVKPFSF